MPTKPLGEAAITNPCNTPVAGTPPEGSDNSQCQNGINGKHSPTSINEGRLAGIYAEKLPRMRSPQGAKLFSTDSDDTASDMCDYPSVTIPVTIVEPPKYYMANTKRGPPIKTMLPADWFPLGLTACEKCTDGKPMLQTVTEPVKDLFCLANCRDGTSLGAFCHATINLEQTMLLAQIWAVTPQQMTPMVKSGQAAIAKIIDDPMQYPVHQFIRFKQWGPMAAAIAVCITDINQSEDPKVVLTRLSSNWAAVVGILLYNNAISPPGLNDRVFVDPNRVLNANVRVSQLRLLNEVLALMATKGQSAFNYVMLTYNMMMTRSSMLPCPTVQKTVMNILTALKLSGSSLTGYIGQGEHKLKEVKRCQDDINPALQLVFK